MPKPLSLFIRPPYLGSETPPGPWTRVYGYGTDTSGGIHSHTLLQSSGDAQLYAVADGKLSMRPPGVLSLSSNEELELTLGTEPSPESVTLYLHVSPVILSQSAFRTRAAQAFGLPGFAYLHVETASLQVALGELLDQAVQPALPRDQVIQMFLSGELDVPVNRGHLIGWASPLDTPAGTRQVGFAAVSEIGMLDSSYVYDLMRDFVEDGQGDLDRLLALMPKRWPVIDSSVGRDQVIGLTQQSLYPMPVLEELHTRYALDHAEWRQVGDNQKRLFQQRLLRRVGHWNGPNPPPPFEFDDADWKNVFQLEAIAEFYANFDDPWAPGATPRLPGDPAYISVDFLDLTGQAATVAQDVVTLDGNPALARVWAGRDTISLANDTNPSRSGKMYRITKVNTATGKVTLDGKPQLSGGSSPWIIHRRPTLVMIDSFGPREGLRGNSATISSPNVVVLGATTNLNKVNVNFDTIYLPSDTARASRTYRITQVNTAAHTVTVDGTPVLEGGFSAWQIPGGLSGELPAFSQPYNLGPNNPPAAPDPRGNDHYGAVAFVLHGGNVKGRVRFSTYTSRAHPVGASTTSSIRGNRQYRFRSFRSGKPFLNYCFKVEDPGANDTVANARYYFPAAVTVDADGKKLIRIHLGNRNKPSGGNNSEGCIVSPSFYDLRALLIGVYQDEYRVLNAPAIQDAEIHKATETDHQKVLQIYAGTLNGGLSETNWNDKINGVLWIVRPDERSIT